MREEIYAQAIVLRQHLRQAPRTIAESDWHMAALAKVEGIVELTRPPRVAFFCTVKGKLCETDDIYACSKCLSNQ